MYSGREGAAKSKRYGASGGSLSDYEMTHGNVIQTTTGTVPRSDFGDAAKMPGGNAVKIFKKTISWNNTVTESMLTPDTTDGYSIDIDNATITDETFTLTYYIPAAAGGASTQANTYEYDSSPDIPYNTVVNLEDVNIGSLAGSNKRFVGWYEADEDGNATDMLLSTQANFGQVIVKDTTIIAVFGAAAYSGDGNWHIYVDDQEVTREMYTVDSGRYYNDTIVRLKDGDNDTDIELPDNGKVGIIVVNDNGTGATINNISSEALTKYANALNTSGRSGKATIDSQKCTVTNVFTSSVTKFGRSDLAVRADYDTYKGSNYAVYAYFYDGSTYTFATVKTGSYTAYAGD